MMCECSAMTHTFCCEEHKQWYHVIKYVEAKSNVNFVVNAIQEKQKHFQI